MDPIAKLTDDINSFFGVDAAYYGVDSFGIAMYLYSLGYRLIDEEDNIDGD